MVELQNGNARIAHILNLKEKWYAMHDIFSVKVSEKGCVVFQQGNKFRKWQNLLLNFIMLKKNT